jgi:hypothetical protein
LELLGGKKMAESMRGMRLGSQSLESDVGVELSARQSISFLCPKNHRFDLVFAQGVELPTTWQCQFCQSSATRLIDGAVVVDEAASDDGPRTHFDMVKERRSVQELEQLLEEMLVSMRKRRSEGQISV